MITGTLTSVMIIQRYFRNIMERRNSRIRKRRIERNEEMKTKSPKTETEVISRHKCKKVKDNISEITMQNIREKQKKLKIPEVKNMMHFVVNSWSATTTGKKSPKKIRQKRKLVLLK